MEDEARYLDHLYIVSRVVARFMSKVPMSVSRDDLLSAARTALWWTVINRKDLPPEDFERYAWTRVRGAVIDELRENSWYDRRRKAVPVVLALGSWPPDAPDLHGPSPDEGTFSAERTARLNRALSGLEEREFRIFEMYYGLGLRMRDIAAELGVTEPRICQIHKRVISKLKASLAADGGEE